MAVFSVVTPTTTRKGVWYVLGARVFVRCVFVLSLTESAIRCCLEEKDRCCLEEKDSALGGKTSKCGVHASMNPGLRSAAVERTWLASRTWSVSTRLEA